MPDFSSRSLRNVTNARYAKALPTDARARFQELAEDVAPLDRD